MAKNKTSTTTRGAHGFELGFNLYDATNTKVPPSGTVKIFVKKQGATSNYINGETCEIAGPYTMEGKQFDARYAFTDAEMDNIGSAAKQTTYLFRFNMTNGSQIDYFPEDPRGDWGKLIVNAP